MTFCEIYFIIGALVVVITIPTKEYRFNTFAEVLSFLLKVAIVWTFYPIFIIANALKD